MQRLYFCLLFWILKFSFTIIIHWPPMSTCLHTYFTIMANASILLISEITLPRLHARSLGEKRQKILCHSNFVHVFAIYDEPLFLLFIALRVQHCCFHTGGKHILDGFHDYTSLHCYFSEDMLTFWIYYLGNRYASMTFLHTDLRNSTAMRPSKLDTTNSGCVTFV